MLSITGAVKIAGAIERLQKTVDAVVQANQVHITHSERVMQINEVYLSRAYANAHLEKMKAIEYKAEALKANLELEEARIEIHRLQQKVRELTSAAYSKE